MNIRTKLFCILLPLSLCCVPTTINAQETVEDSVDLAYPELLSIGEDINGNFISYGEKEIVYGYRLQDGKMYYEEMVGDSYMKRVYIHSVDIKSFESLDYEYAKDKYRVYYEGKVVLGAEPKSFVTKVFDNETHEDNRLAKDERYIVSNGRAIRESDANSFRRIAPQYYADKNNIYNAACIMLDDADPNNFRYLKYNALISNNNVYYGYEKIEGADADSFRSVNDYKCFADKKHYYYEGYCLEGSDSNLELRMGTYPFFSNNGNLYAMHEKIEGDNAMLPQSTEFGAFSKNDANVYWYKAAISGADPKTFKEISNNYGVDAEGLFRYDEFICNIDGASIKELDKDIFHDNYSLYHIMYSRLGTKIDIDINSFRRLKENYYVDKNGAYYLSAVEHATDFIQIDGIDYDTFEIIDEYYAKDKNHIYYNSDILEKMDPNSFEIIGDGYVKDKNYIFFKNKRLGNLASSTAIVKIECPYLVTDNSVFYTHLEMKDVDVNSFEIIDRNYTKDENAVYYEGVKIENADAKTFRKITDKVSCDKEHAWEGRTLIGKVDGASFSHLKDNVYKDNAYLYINTLFDIEEKKIEIDGKSLQSVGENYWIDKKNVYIGLLSYPNDNNDNFRKKNIPYISGLSKIKKANPKTFATIDKKNSKDKKNVYYIDKIVAGADPKSFIVIDENSHDGIAYDKRHIYAKDKQKETIEPPFIYLGNRFFKDRSYLYEIYHEDAIYKYHIQDDLKLDSKSLRLVDDELLEDRNGTYNWKDIKK